MNQNDKATLVALVIAHQERIDLLKILLKYGSKILTKDEIVSELKFNKGCIQRLTAAL